MKIILNGQPLELTAPLNITTCLEQKGYEGKLVAVAINGDFIPRGSYDATILQDGDQIEIVAPMQGG